MLFRDTPLHDIFVYYLNHAYAFQVLLGNTPGSILASEHSQLQSPKLWNPLPELVAAALRLGKQTLQWCSADA